MFKILNVKLKQHSHSHASNTSQPMVSFFYQESELASVLFLELRYYQQNQP